jgi:hypothetical protein
MARAEEVIELENLLQCECRLLARVGRSMCAQECLFLVEKRSCSGHNCKTDFDPKRSLRR